MRFYLIKSENELHIIPVNAKKERAFRQRYAGKIILSAESPPEVLLSCNRLTEFNEWNIIVGNGV
jgi:hypothetical protein